MRGSQNYTINTWWQASSMEWHWQGARDHSDHPAFKGWVIPRENPMPAYIPPPSAPPPIQAVAVAPTPIVMGQVVGGPYRLVQSDEEGACGSMLGCCPKR